MTQPERQEASPQGSQLRQKLISSLTFEHLRTFQFIVQTGSFRQAANQLFVTQSAISQRIHSLEKVLGANIFDRQRGTAICLTEAGELLLSLVDEVLPKLYQFDLAIRQVSDAPDAEEEITLVTGFNLMKYRVLDSITKFNRRHPRTKIKLMAGVSSEQMRELLRSGAADLAFFPTVPGGGHMRSLGTAKDQMFLVARGNHSILDLPESERLARLHSECFAVSPEGTVSRQLAERWAKAHHLRLRIVLEAHNLDALKVAVGAGDVLAIIPSFAIASEVASGELTVVSAPGFPIERRLSLIAAAERSLSPASRALAAALGTALPSGEEQPRSMVAGG